MCCTIIDRLSANAAVIVAAKSCLVYSIVSLIVSTNACAVGSSIVSTIAFVVGSYLGVSSGLLLLSLAVFFVGGFGVGFYDIVVVFVIAAAVATVAGEMLYFCLLFGFPGGTSVRVVRFVGLGCC